MSRTQKAHQTGTIFHTGSIKLAVSRLVTLSSISVCVNVSRSALSQMANQNYIKYQDILKIQRHHEATKSVSHIQLKIGDVWHHIKPPKIAMSHATGFDKSSSVASEGIPFGLIQILDITFQSISTLPQKSF